VAGPFHPSFRELVETSIWSRLLEPVGDSKGKEIEIRVPKGQINYAVGYGGKNKQMLQRSFDKVNFTVDDHLSGRSFELRSGNK
jgi:hypothetical protein